MFFKQFKLRHAWLYTALLATLALAGCSDDDKKGIVLHDQLGQGGAMFHGAQWATIKDLDPRGEQCVDCHGKNNDMSPYSNGTMAHNVGLQKFIADESVQNLKVTSAKVENGKVVVQLNQALPAAVNPSMTFAKLAPRVRHDRGHDWQNYLSASSTRNTGEGAVLDVGLAPQLANENNILEVSNNRRTLTIDLTTDSYNWGEHEFDVTYKSGTTGQDAGGTATYKVTGTKVKVEGIAQHVSCFVGHANAYQQIAESDTGVGLDNKTNGTLLCWWPDGTALPAGVFISDDDHVIVSYEETYTHRVTLLTGAGRPAYNTWFDFVPDGTALPQAYSAESAAQNDPASRDVVDIQSCNSCHDSLALSPGIHGAGGSRSETQVCVTCHNPGNLQPSTGRSVDFKQLVHRIHRGDNLPSVSGTVTNVSTTENATGGHGLLSDRATDWTKVRFPQGPNLGNAAGITNCVKCHMGPETNRIVQDFSNEVGPGLGFDVQSELKLAKVTPQGDNWLSVRNIEACRACHDSQIWMNGDGHENGSGNGILAVMQTAIPLYGSDYLDIGYDWIGFKGANTATAGNKHRARTIGSSNNQFTCGSGGGCHGNDTLSTLIPNDPDNDLDTAYIGDNGSNSVHRRHLRLTRDYILSERFEVEVLEADVNETGFSVKAQIIDKQDNSVVIPDISQLNGETISIVSNNTRAMFGWMANGSPDYNHSAGGGAGPGRPGSPTERIILDFDTNGIATAEVTWNAINAMGATVYDWEKDFNKETSFGSVVVTVELQTTGGTYRLRTANQDFAFNGTGLIDMTAPARRQVVDFTAGRGVEFSHEDGNTQSCSSCHLQFNFHYGVSNNTQMCIMCHNPNLTDIGHAGREKINNMVQIGSDTQYEESEDFKRLIHAVHAAGGKDARVRGQKMRIDPLQTRANLRPSPDGEGPRGHSFPGVLSNCQSCHIENETGEFAGLWTFDLLQLPKGMIGSSAITADWKNVEYSTSGTQNDISTHYKMTPIASVCSSCHDAGYKTSEGRMNNNILDGGPYVGSHWWVMGGIAPGIVPDDGTAPQDTKHQSGEL